MATFVQNQLQISKGDSSAILLWGATYWYAVYSLIGLYLFMFQILLLCHLPLIRSYLSDTKKHWSIGSFRIVTCEFSASSFSAELMYLSNQIESVEVSTKRSISSTSWPSYQFLNICNLIFDCEVWTRWFIVWNLDPHVIFWIFIIHEAFS
jgi:hypothetical protein